MTKWNKLKQQSNIKVGGFDAYLDEESFCSDTIEAWTTTLRLNKSFDFDDDFQNDEDEQQTTKVAFG